MELKHVAAVRPPAALRGWIFDLNGVLVHAGWGSFVHVIPGAFRVMENALKRYPEKIGICTQESRRTAESALFFLNADIPARNIMCNAYKRDPVTFDEMAERLRVSQSQLGCADDSIVAIVAALISGCAAVVYIRPKPGDEQRLLHEIERQRRTEPACSCLADADKRLFIADTVSAIHF